MADCIGPIVRLHLVDDGTLDTVFICDECGGEERVTTEDYESSEYLSGDQPFDEDRIRWSREVAGDHECEGG